MRIPILTRRSDSTFFMSVCSVLLWATMLGRNGEAQESAFRLILADQQAAEVLNVMGPAEQPVLCDQGKCHRNSCSCADSFQDWASIADDGLAGGSEPALGSDFFDDRDELAFSYNSTPGVIADFFGDDFLVANVSDEVRFQFPTRGFIAAGGPGNPNAVLVFEANGGLADDFFTTGTGVDRSGDGLPDTFAMTEPLPPNEVPTSPGPEYAYAGGSVVYTNSANSQTAANGAFASNQFWFASYAFSRNVRVVVPAGGLAVRRLKLAENNSPFPRDRVLFNYNFFNDVRAPVGDVSRYTVGFEKTFLDGLGSVEFRAPFAATLDSNQIADGSAARNFEWGNLGVVVKLSILAREQFIWSGGVGFGSPTADDSNAFLSNGTRVLRLQNDALHVLPFLAGLWMPGDRSYLQGFVQADVDVNGNAAFGNIAGGRLPRIGTLHSASLLFVDVAAGHWLYRNPNGRLTGIVPTAEVHYSTMLQNADAVVGNGLQLQSDLNRVDTVNLTFGSHFLFGSRLKISPAMVLPIRSGDRQFDFEAIVQTNYEF